MSTCNAALSWVCFLAHSQAPQKLMDCIDLKNPVIQSHDFSHTKCKLQLCPYVNSCPSGQHHLFSTATEHNLSSKGLHNGVADFLP